MIKRPVLVAVCVFAAAQMSYAAQTSGVGAAEAFIKKGETLSLDRCIEIALNNQPNVIAAVNSVVASRSRIGQAQSAYYPQINASAGYSRISPVVSRVSVSGLSTSSGTGPSSFDQYNASAALNQNIYDFGKTPAEVRVQKENLESTTADYENAQSLVAFNVKQAYYTVLVAQKQLDVAGQTVKQLEQHLEQAKGFYEVGTHPKFDVTTAEVNLSNGRVNLIVAGNNLKIDIVNLNNAMGLPDAPDYSIEDSLAFQKYEVTLDDAFQKAYVARPDLKSSAAKARSAEESLAVARTGYYPALTGNAQYGLSGQSFPLDRSWSAGVAINIPIFSGFLTKYQVEEAKANLNVAKANEDLVRQTVFSDVKQSYLNLKAAEDRIPASELAVKQAAENLDLANGRYTTGVGNPVEVTDAQVAYTNAQVTYITALGDYRTARAALEKAMGLK
jgi:outer membrane protein